jgi:hypothetical protein
MKNVSLALIALAMVLPAGCKKQEAKLPTASPAAQPAPAAEPKVAEPSGPAIPEVPLTGTPSENLVAVFEAGVNALKSAPDAASGAAVLNGMLEKYDVADLRAKSKAAKEGGQGASPELKQKLASLKEEYNEVSTKLGGTDPAAFGGAAKAWATAWGLN